MTKITDIKEHKNKQRLRIVRINKSQKYDKFMIAMRSAMNSAKASRNWTKWKKTHLLNCRDALDRALFYLEDELDENNESNEY